MSAVEEFVDILKTVGIAVGVTLLFRFFFFQPFNIPSSSMQPTLMVGDFILVDKIEYGYSKASLIYPLTRLDVHGRVFENLPERGDIAVFKNTHDHNKDYVKRVIGLPGDKIQMIRGVLYLNGDRVERELATDIQPACQSGRQLSNMIFPAAKVYRETLPNGVSYIIQECLGDNNRNANTDNTRIYEVPEGHFFMMGDNRDNSADSRTPVVQFVPADQFVGKATRVVFSVDGARARLWEPWKWPTAIRYGRMFEAVE